MNAVTIPNEGALCYLATPYSKWKAGLEDAFIEASKLAARLLRSGVKVYSPIAHTHPLAIHGKLDPFDHSIWLPFDEAMMKVADVLIVAQMDGWRDSFGIAQEIKFFEAARKPIWDLNPDTMAMVKRQIPKPPRDRYELQQLASKQFCEMSLDELRDERKHWDDVINSAPGWGASVAVAAEFRNDCDRWIERRKSEASFAHDKSPREHGGSSA